MILPQQQQSFLPTDFGINSNAGINPANQTSLGIPDFSLAGGNKSPISPMNFQVPDYTSQAGANFPGLSDLNVPGIDDPGTQGFNFTDFLFGKSEQGDDGAVLETPGALKPISSALGSVANIYFGLKSMNMAEDQFDFQKKAFKENFDANKLSFNNQVQSRADAVANATSNADLGIADNATPAQRAEAEAKFANERSSGRKL